MSRTAAIGRALDALAREERVAVLFAVESGIRVWDFASPGNDRDVRFLVWRNAAEELFQATVAFADHTVEAAP